MVDENCGNSVFKHFIAGWIGGSAGIIVGHPFETVKVQMQIAQRSAKLKQTLNDVGNFGLSRGFYRGISFPLLSQGVLCAIFFGGYGYTSDFLRQRWPDIPDNVRALIAGCVGGAVQLVPCCPIEIIKCNLQARLSPKSKRYFHGPVDCLRSIYHESGVKGTFRGFLIHGVRDIIGYGTYAFSEVSFIEILHGTNASSGAFSSGKFLAGGLAGSISWFLVTPLDVVKCRIQSNNFRLGPREFYQFIANIARNEGLCAFFKGGLISVLRAFPVNTVTLPLYHFFEQKLKDSF